MKSSLKILGAFTFLFALSIAFFAFKPSDNIAKKERVTKWFIYDGSGSQTDASNYGAPADQSPGCEGAEQVCSIRAEENGSSGQPVIDASLQMEINNALSNPSGSHPNVELINP